MPKISMWHPNRGVDFNFANRTSAENLKIGGAGILVHKYLGPASGGDEMTIEDFLFLENRNRRYDDTIYEVRGHYTPFVSDFDLTQFGIFFTNGTLKFTFHYDDMADILGRRIISGDVLELPGERDSTLDGETIAEYFVVQDALWSNDGYGSMWIPTLWSVRTNPMDAAPEYQDVLDNIASGSTIGGEGNGTGIMPIGYGEAVTEDGDSGFGCDKSILNSINRYCKLVGITDEVVSEAAENAFYDPKFLETAHLYITIDEETGYPLMSYWVGGDGAPPNGAPLKGMGTKFPIDMNDGEYFLRLDYKPDRLFQKQGNCFMRIEDDLRKIWTAYNRRLDTYIDNINTTILDSGEQMREKQAISKVIPAKTDLNAAHKEATLKDQTRHERIAKRMDGAQ